MKHNRHLRLTRTIRLIRRLMLRSKEGGSPHQNLVHHQGHRNPRLNL